MRVPALNWPADLFTDATEPGRTVIVRPAAMPTLWNDMVSSWVGSRTHLECGALPSARPDVFPEATGMGGSSEDFQAGIRTFNSVMPWIRLE